MALQWVSADLLTGQILADLPTFVPEWPLRRTLCQYETATGDLYLDGAPPNWEDAIREGGAVLACYDDDDPARSIQWAGMVTEEVRDTAEDKIAVSLVTVEGYLDRRFVGTVTYTAQGQNAIAADLVTEFAADGAVPGLPVVTVNVDGVDRTPRDRTYLDSDNKTVYAALGELAGVEGGIEWTIEWTWSTDETTLVPFFTVGSRIGQAAPAGRVPEASFAMPGPVVQAQQVRSFADGKGANVVQAYSSGQGDTVPTSGPVAAADFAGRPTFEFRYQPSSSITDPATLTAHAQAALALLAPGQRALTVTAALLPETRHGGLWLLGDDVAYQIGGTVVDAPALSPGDDLIPGSSTLPGDSTKRELVAAFPGGLAGVGRAIAYEVAQDDQNGSTIAPILALAEVTIS